MACNDDGSRAVVSEASTVHYLSWNGTAVSELQRFTTTGGIVQRGGAKFSKDGQFVALYTDRLTVYSVGATSLTQVAQSATFSGGRALAWNADGTRIYMHDRVFTFDGSSLTQESTHSGVRYIDVDASERFIAFATNTGGGTFESFTLADAETKAPIDSASFVDNVSWLQFFEQ